VPISAALPVTEESAGAGEPIRGDAIEATLVERFTDVSAVTEVYRVQVMAGREQDSAPHASGVTEHWIVYAGVLELGPAEAMVRLAPGESTSFRADVPHRYRASSEGDVAATLVVRYPV